MIPDGNNFGIANYSMVDYVITNVSARPHNYDFIASPELPRTPTPRLAFEAFFFSRPVRRET